LLAQPDRFTIETEYVAGTPLEKLDPAQVNADKLFDQGLSLLQTLRKAGIAHGDLGHDHWQSMGRESNLIWTTDERLVAIDFAGSLPLGLPFRPLRNFCQALHHHDRLLLSKIGHHFCPERLGRSAEVDWPVGLWDLLRLLGKV
jgi:predicted unusual protein kinase regulating ubiquinone biosynthesis (AarF/ABC1/UbiB family)